MGTIRIKKIIFVTLLCVIALSSCGLVSATDQSVITVNNNVNLTVANDNGVRFNDYPTGTNENNTYNFFNAGQSAGQGLNALYITTTNTSTKGGVVSSNDSNGTIYLSDTGGRGWDDDGILMIAVNGTIPDNFSINIVSSGYQWTPVPTGTYPSFSNVTYYSVAMNQTFYKSDFIYGPQIWRPAPGTGNLYPIFDNQLMTDTNNTFSILFVDLYAGIIGTNTLVQGLGFPDAVANNLVKDNGMLKVSYIINNLPEGSILAFDAYAYTVSSNQGQGIRWTNRLSDTGASGYIVNGQTNISGNPELVASNLEVPDSPAAGTSYTVNATVTNTGGSDASSFVAKLYDNNVQVGKIVVSGLASGVSTVLNFNWTPNTVGDHVLSVIADVNKQINETNRTNSQITQTISVIASTLPELVTSNLQLPTDPINGTAYTVNVTVANTGLGDAGSFVVKLFDNNVQIGKIVVSGLAAGANTVLNFNWTPNTVGSHTLSVIADANKQISETNRNNNQITQTIDTTASTLPELTATNLELPETPVVGTTYTINVTIANTGASDINSSFAVKLYDNNTQIQKIIVNSLSSGASTILTFNWTPTTTGTHNLSVIADANKQLTEIIETNNQITTTTTVN